MLLAIGKPFFPSGMSYQPGDPLHVESFRYPERDRHSVIPVVDTLYEKKASLGDIEVGLASVYGAQILVVLENGKFASVIPRNPDLAPVDVGGKMRFYGVFPRGGELHAFVYSDYVFTMSYGPQNPSWYAFAIGPDGQFRHAGDGSADDIYRWDEVWEFTSPEMDTFGVRGSTIFPDGGLDNITKPTGVEITYTWDPKEKKYTSKKTIIPVPKRPKKSK